MENLNNFKNINLEAVKGVLLDLDGTVYEYNNCHQVAIKGCYEYFNKEIDKNFSFTEFNNFYIKKRQNIVNFLKNNGSCRSRLFAFQAMFEELNIDQNFEKAKDFDDLYWNIFIDNMIISEDALEFLEKCEKLNIQICILTDMISNIQIRKLQKLAISKKIKYLVSSEEVGVEKPHNIIFEIALKKLNLTKKEVIMIGVSEDKDIQGANSIGIKSYKIIL